MSTLLLKFGTVESRISSSFSCSRGVLHGVGALTLRRWSQLSKSRPNFIGSTGNLTPQRKYTRVERDVPVSVLSVRALHHYHLSSAQETVADGRDGSSAGTQRYSTRGRGFHDSNINDQSYTLYQDVASVEFLPQVEADTAPLEKSVYEALKRNDPNALLRSLIQLVKFDGVRYSSSYLRGVDPNTFSAILRCLDPEHFIGRYGKLYEEMNRQTLKVLGLRDDSDTGYHHFRRTFLSQIQGIVAARRRDNSLTMADYKYLLKCARAAGNVEVAHLVWKSMTSGENGLPDADCYNHYLATLCWTERSNTHQRYELRVIPHNMTRRAGLVENIGTVPNSLQGHKIGSGGIKAMASGVFKHMVGTGVAGNEETFCLMITALAREGDIDGVASILDRIWHINVEAILTTDEADLPQVMPYAQDSPFYPSEDLLFTLAHVYGINNSIPTALRVIDYVARQYNIRITPPVWNELLRWTFVLSSVPGRGREQAKRGTSIGRLPPEAVSNVWATMTSEPYNIQPTMEMYDRLIRNLIFRERFGEAKMRMQEARNLHNEYLVDFSRRNLIYETRRRTNNLPTEKEQRDLAFARLHLRRSRLYILRWVQLFLGNGSRDLKYNENFAAKDLPDFLKEWDAFLPTIVSYEIASGAVMFRSDTRFVHLDRRKRMSDRKSRDEWLDTEFARWFKVPRKRLRKSNKRG